MRKVAALLVVVMLVFSMVSPVLASETVEPRYTFTNTVYARIDIDSTWGIATCVGEVIAKNNVPVKLFLYLQVNENGTWRTVKSWELEDSFGAYLSKSYAIYRGYEYRAYVVGYIYNTNNVLVEIVDLADTAWYN